MIHTTAEVDPTAHVGKGTRIWHGAQVRERAHIGLDCMIGRGVYIGPGVIIGNRCKIQNKAQLYQPAQIADGVFIGPGVILTNDLRPRAVLPDLRPVGPEDWNEQGVCVDEGASIGAGAIVLGGRTIGRWAMVGAGAVVTKDVEEHWLVVGNPARRCGWVCACGLACSPKGVCDRCLAHEA